VQRDGARSGRSGGAPDAGLTPTQLDWHCLADGGRADIFDVTLMLADEYGIAVRAWLEPARRKLRDRGLPVVGHDFSWVRQTDHEFLASGRAREVVERRASP
jgi:hypothetical protein